MTQPVTVEWLSRAITQATKSAKFCVTGGLSLVDPGLVVEGLGPIRLPLKPRMVKPLIATCRVAPYGKGTKTLIDQNVRNSYELDAARFRLSEAWDAAIADVTRTVAIELGLPPDLLEARLYKLLVYEKGGFFLPHRDSEKHDRMVASMVVVLPNEFDGGELLVRHGTAEEELRFEEAAAGKAPCYAAFYADCEHEVQPIDRGRRLCLAYNLVLKPQRKKPARGAAPTAPEAALAESISTWIARRPGRPLVFALEHHYTQHGLSLDLLKGGDRRLADLIVSSAEQAGCLVHLAQVERHLLQFADDGSFGRGYRRGYGEDDAPWREITIGETYEDKLHGEQWTDLHGKKQPWGAIPFDTSSIVSEIPLDDWKPTSQHFEGYTGNEGNSLDRWYHRSALVVWHRDQHFDVIVRSGVFDCIPLFRAMMAKLAKTPKKRIEEFRDECLRFARAIIRGWPCRSYWRHHSENQSTAPEEVFSELLLRLHDQHAISLFLSTVAERDQALQLDEFVPAACREFGARAFEPELRQLISARSDRPGREEILPRDMQWLSAVCCDEIVETGRLALANELCALAVKRFLEPFETRHPYPARNRREKSDSEVTLLPLVQALAAIGRDDDLSRLLGFVQQNAEEFRLEECQVPALKALIPWARKRFSAVPPRLASWLATVRQTLKTLTATEPLPPTNWSRPAEVDCQCRFCAQLNAFLFDSATEVGRISAREDIRQHVIMNIDRHQCDVKHALDRRGSPYTLVLTKTTGSFERVLKRFRTDQKLLEELPTLSDKR